MKMGEKKIYPRRTLSGWNWFKIVCNDRFTVLMEKGEERL
jgi:hypothetical protein